MMPRNLVGRFLEIKNEEGFNSALQSAGNFFVQHSFSRVPYSTQKYLYKRYYSKDVEQFDLAPDPYTPLHVNPSKVERFTGREWPPWKGKFKALGSVRDGDWDITNPSIISGYEECKEVYELFRSETFEKSIFFQSFKQRFMDSVEWENTEFVSRCLELAERDIPSWKGYTSKDEILTHCANVDDLFKNIQKSGYKSQMELGNVHTPADVTKEVCVDIDRRGGIMFVNGRHRMAISKLLDVETIPVCVLVRHRKWMDKRTSLKDCSKDLDHPDLANL